MMSRISVVERLPVNYGILNVFQIDDHLYVCGRKTFQLKEQLKSWGGQWISESKCWEFPLSFRNELETLLHDEPGVPIPNAIETISQVPVRVAGSIQIYQMNGRILICGSKTYQHRDALRQLGGHFDFERKCWEIPSNKAGEAQALVNEIRLTVEETKRQEKEKERQRLIRLQQVETEASGRKEVDELQAEWESQLTVMEWKQRSDNLVQAIVTYSGEVKPPNLAMAYMIDNWQVRNRSAQVERIDYKKYLVSVFME